MTKLAAFVSFITLIFLVSAIPAQQTETTATQAKPEAVSQAVPEGFNDPAKAVSSGDRVKLTAKGRAGSTSVTVNMPTDFAGLLAARKPFLGKPEFRGAWITRFDWTSPNPQTARAKIIKQLDDAKAEGMNAVVFQLRGEASTLYPSSLEPWSELLGGKDPGFDPAQFAVDEAHKRGLQFHAYFNVATCTSKGKPSSPNHIWFKHCQPESSPNWLVYEKGKPAQFSEYTWLNLNLPEVQTYIRRAAVDLVSRYGIDGLHYDRVRSPSSTVSDDPWSKARFKGDGNPYNLEWQAWQRDNLNRLLTDIYGSVCAMKPKLEVSASVWGIYDKTLLPPGDKTTGYSWTSTGLQNYNQDSIAWTRIGCVDALVPMIYWDMGGLKPDYDEPLAFFTMNAANGRQIWGGVAVYDGLEILREVVATNLIGASGTCVFTSSIVAARQLIPYYKQNIYPDTVPTPPMPWKVNPRTGIVLVTVKTAAGVPVMDAHVTAPNSRTVWLSSADGFCAIINAPPGNNYTLSAIKPSTGQKGASAPFAVTAGRGTPVEIICP